VDEDDFFGELKLGANLPSGYFKLTDPENAYSGHATTGAEIKASMGYHLIKTFGFVANFSYAYNPINTNTLKGFYDAELDEFLLKQYPDSDVSSSGLTTQGYFSHGVKGGIFVAIPIDKVKVDIRTMAGYYSLSRPKIDYKATLDPEMTYKVTDKKIRGSGLYYSVGADVSYKLSRKLWVSTYIKYQRSEPNVEKVPSNTTIKESGYSNTDFLNWTPKVESFVIGAGVRYTLQLKSLFRRSVF
jgi:hypothetical protein